MSRCAVACPARLRPLGLGMCDMLLSGLGLYTRTAAPSPPVRSTSKDSQKGET